MTLLSELLADSPKFLLKLDETSGTTANDASPNNLDGSISGVWTMGAPGLVPSAPAETSMEPTSGLSAINLHVGSGALTTFAAYARVSPNNTTSGNRVIVSDQDSAVASWTFRQEGADLKFYIWHSSGALTVCTAAGVLTGGVAYSAGCELDATHMRIYLDGVQVASLAKTAGAPYNSASTYRVACAGTGERWVGRIAYATVFETAVGAARMAAYHTAALTAPPEPPEPEPEPVPLEGTYTVTATITTTTGVHTWTVSDGDEPAYGLADPLVVEWTLPAAGLERPAQPDPLVAQVAVIVEEAGDLPVGVGDLVQITVHFGTRPATDRRPDVGFIGRVADGTATPHRQGIIYQLTCAGLMVDLVGYDAGVTALPAQTARSRFDTLVGRAGIAAADLEPDPILAWDPALYVDRLEPEATNLLELLGQLLDQVTFTYADRLYRGILAARPGAAAGTPRWYVDSLSDEYVATAEAPLPALFGPLGSPTPYGLTIDPDDRAAGVIDACYVDFDAAWTALIPDVANKAVVTWASVPTTAAATDADTVRTPLVLYATEWTAPTPKVAKRDTTTLATTDAGAAAAAEANANRLADLATLPPQTRAGWSPDTFTWLLWRDAAGLEGFPVIFPAVYLDPATEGTRVLRTAAYVRPLVITPIPARWDPTRGSAWSAGQASAVRLTIADGRPVVELTLSPTLPVPGNPETTVPLWDAVAGTWDAQVGTWDDRRGGYVIFRWDDPALAPATWDTLEATQTWYEYRLARGTA